MNGKGRKYWIKSSLRHSLKLSLKIIKFNFIWRTDICIFFNRTQNFELQLDFVTKYNHKISAVLLSLTKHIELWHIMALNSVSISNICQYI